VPEGEYEMAVGFGPGMDEPPVAARVVVGGNCRYEMTHPASWHFVRPLARPTLSVMVTGKSCKREAPRSTRPSEPLTEEQVAELFRRFRSYYPGPAVPRAHADPAAGPDRPRD
jgi:hypothetical protein